MDKLEVTASFIAAGKVETVGQNNFLVRKFWVDITSNPEWPNTPEFKLKGDKVSLVDHLQKGQKILIKFNIDGRKYTNQQTGKSGVITELQAWKIDVITTQSAAAARPAPSAPPAVPPVQAPVRPAAAQSQPATGFEGGDDDLPF